MGVYRARRALSGQTTSLRRLKKLIASNQFIFEGMIMKQYLISALMGTAMIMSGCSPSADELARRATITSMMGMIGVTMPGTQNTQVTGKVVARLWRHGKTVMILGCERPRYPVVFYPNLSSVQSHLPPNTTEEDLKQGVVVDGYKICGLPKACYISSSVLSNQGLAELQKCFPREQQPDGKIRAYLIIDKAVAIDGCTDFPIIYPDLSAVRPHLPPNTTEEDLKQGVVVDNPALCVPPVPDGKTRVHLINNKEVIIKGCAAGPLTTIYSILPAVRPYLPPNTTEEDLKQGVVMDNPELCRLLVPEACRHTVMTAQDPQVGAQFEPRITFGQCLADERQKRLQERLRERMEKMEK